MATDSGARGSDRDWRDVVAVGLVAGDASPAALVRFGGVGVDEADRALRAATHAGVLSSSGIDDRAARDLLDSLDPAALDRAHATVALHLMKAGPEHFTASLEHARAARGLPQPDLVRLARSSGRLALAAGDHEVAELLLAAVLELDVDDDLDRPHLLFDLAQAVDGCGRSEAARDLLNEVVRLADAGGHVDLLVDAAIRSAFPADFRAGDRRTASLLDLAERYEGDGPRAAAVLAARAMVEMRIPAAGDEQQYVWVTRAGLAQPMAERALSMTHGDRDADRLVALAAWRATHRSPALLAQRLELSREAVDLAQRLLHHDRLVDASIALAVDSLESGDRAEYDQCLATVRWAAQTDGNPRLQWWAATASAGAALIDGDLDAADRHRAEAAVLGRSYDLPGWLASDIILAAESALEGDDRDELQSFMVGPDDPVLASPIARAGTALIAARLGDHERALAEAPIAMRKFDEESSLLLCLTLLARAVVGLDAPELRSTIEERLGPWAGHVAVDPSGWWCTGPVDLALAQLAADDGRLDEAAAHLDRAEPIIDGVGDARGASITSRLRADLDAGGPTTGRALREVPGIESLTGRERDVLTLIARGGTNASIGAALSFSPSTIRADTVSIYRKLGVNGRAEAAAVAVTAGLAEPVG